MHLFGMAGSACAALGTLVMVYLAIVWLIQGSLGWRPLLFFGITALVVGIQLVSVGLLGEMLRNVTFRADEEYSIHRILELNQNGEIPPEGQAPCGLKEGIQESDRT
jgi:fatty acid desaturase